MALDEATRKQLERLMENERSARVTTDTARTELVKALEEARQKGATVRELAAATGLSHQLVHYLTHNR